MNAINKPIMICLIIMLNLPVHPAKAQRNYGINDSFKARNAVYVEVGGLAVTYSINYDRIFADRGLWKVGGRIGFALHGLTRYDSRYVGEVYTLKPLRNKPNRYLELGLGFLYRSPRLISEIGPLTDLPAVGISPRVGFRLQKPAAGWLVRVGFNPIISKEADNPVKVAPWAGLSVGHSF